ncbi:GcrA family cell cycle regulator, partial [Microvirga aerophila]
MHLRKAPSIEAPDPNHRTKLLKIGARQCRYIVSDDPRHAVFCGASTREASSWCDWHRRLVYVPSQPGRGER